MYGWGTLVGLVSSWMPGPQQRRRSQINALKKQMFDLQNAVPYDALKYQLLSEQLSRIQSDAANEGQ